MTLRHSELNRRILLDWIKACDDEGRDMPTDEAIAERFNFAGIEHARTLLADISDRGLITIRGAGSTRGIRLGKTRPAAVPTARPAPAVARPDRDDPGVDAAVDRIRSILGGSGRPMAERMAQASKALAPVQIVKATAMPAAVSAPAAPPKVDDLTPVVAPVGPRKQTNMTLPPDVLTELERRGKAKGVPASSIARDLITDLLRGKALVPVEACTRAQIVGASIHDFASMLIRIGLQHYLGDMPEAAE